jgi:lipoate-protein ligase A
MVWRLIADGEHSAAWNMALDQAVIDAVESGMAPPTLRIYGWNETAVTVGRFQSVARDVDTDFCSANGIPIVRRPTGGRGILHGSDVTVSIAVPQGFLGARTSVAAAYERLCAGFMAAFETMGLPVRRGSCERPAMRSGDCFQVRSAADLIASDGTKIVGSALRRVTAAALMQSSVRHTRPEFPPSRIFHGAVEEGHYPLEHVEEEDLRDAIIQGFRSALEVKLLPGDLTGWEEERAAVLVKSVRFAENSSEEAVSTAGG